MFAALTGRSGHGFAIRLSLLGGADVVVAMAGAGCPSVRMSTADAVTARRGTLLPYRYGSRAENRRHRGAAKCESATPPTSATLSTRPAM